jgi:hypothetical protein
VAKDVAEQPTEVDRIADFGRPAITRRPMAGEPRAANPGVHDPPERSDRRPLAAARRPPPAVRSRLEDSPARPAPPSPQSAPSLVPPVNPGRFRHA